MAATRLDLPALGKPDQRDVGDGLELEDDVATPRRARRAARSRAPCGAPRRARRCRGRHGPPARRRTSCPRPTRSASTSPPGVVTTVPSGTGRTRSLPSAPLRWSPCAGLAAGGLAVRRVVVVEQRRDVGVDDEHDVAAAAAVAAVRAAERLELLPVHGRAAVAAVTGADVQHDVVDEGGHGPPPSRFSFELTADASVKPSRAGR